MLTSVFVVRATTGHYSDRAEWSVAAYPERETAEQHARLANEAMAKLEKEVDRYEWDEDGTTGWERGLRAFPWDHQASNAYDPVHYVVVEVPLVLHPDQYLDLERPTPAPAA